MSNVTKLIGPKPSTKVIVSMYKQKQAKQSSEPQKIKTYYTSGGSSRRSKSSSSKQPSQPTQETPEQLTQPTQETPEQLSQPTQQTPEQLTQQQIQERQLQYQTYSETYQQSPRIRKEYELQRDRDILIKSGIIEGKEFELIPPRIREQQRIEQEKKEAEKLRSSFSTITEAPSRTESVKSYALRMGGNVLEELGQEAKETGVGILSIQQPQLLKPKTAEIFNVDIQQAERTAVKNLAIFGAGAGVGFVAPLVIPSGSVGASALTIAGRVGIGSYVLTKGTQYTLALTEQEKAKVISDSIIESLLFVGGAKFGTRKAREFQQQIPKLEQRFTETYVQSRIAVQQELQTGKGLTKILTQSVPTISKPESGLFADKSGAVFRGNRRISPVSKATLREGRKDIRITQTENQLQVMQRGKGSSQFTAEFEKGQLRAFEKSIKGTAVPTRYKDGFTFAKQSVRVGTRVDISKDGLTTRSNFIREVSQPKIFRARQKDISRATLPKELQSKVLSQFPSETRKLFDIKGSGFVRSVRNVKISSRFKNRLINNKQPTISTTTGSGNQKQELLFKAPKETPPVGFRSAKIKERLLSKVRARQEQFIRDSSSKTPAVRQDNNMIIQQNDLATSLSKFPSPTQKPPKVNIEYQEEIIRGFKPIGSGEISSSSNIKGNLIIDTPARTIYSAEVPKSTIIPFTGSDIKQDTKIEPTTIIQPMTSTDRLTKTDTITSLDLKSSQVSILTPAIKSIQAQDTAQQQDLQTSLNQIQIPSTRTTQKTKPQPSIQQPIQPKIIEPIKQLEIPKPIIKPRPQPPKPKPIKEIIQPPPNRLYIPKLPKARQKINGYDVFVRKAGKFIKKTIQPLRKEEALSYGAFIVGTTARATFKIEKANNGRNLGSFRKDFSRDLKNRFYEKKGTFIERTKFRISTPGELREITYKGIESKKKKRSWFK